jgi:methionine--tRNA ligase beta chain
MTLEEFKKSELRVGKVLVAERVQGSEKLLRLEIDLGEGAPRQVLSGIRKAYGPEEMMGKYVVLIANLEPRMMMGLESKGMLLAASGEDGKPIILTVDGMVPPGTLIT